MPQLVPTQSAAQLLGLSPYTLRQWRRIGEGPAYIRQGRKISYDKKDLADWFDQCRHTPDNTKGRTDHA